MGKRMLCVLLTLWMTVSFCLVGENSIFCTKASAEEDYQRITDALMCLKELQDNKFFANKSSNGHLNGENNTRWTKILKNQIEIGDYTSSLSPDCICVHDTNDHCLPFEGGTQCNGYIRYVCYALFRTLPDEWDVMSGIPTIETLKPGDMLRNVVKGFDENGNEKDISHYRIIVKIENGKIYHLEGNNHGNKGLYCRIHFGTTNLDSLDIRSWKRYSNPSDLKFVYPDEEAPTIIDGPSVSVQNDSKFTIKLRTVDNIGVAQVYARLAYDSPDGIKPDISKGEEALVCNGSIDGDLATITINANDYEGHLRNFWFSCVAVDRRGNKAIADSEVRSVSLYPLTITGKKDCGRFKTTEANAPLCIVPYESYENHDMTSVRVSKGYDNLYVAGKHVNEQGETWYYVEPGLWIKSDYVTRKSNVAEIWNKVSGFKNREFYCIAGSYVEASHETSIKNYKSSNIAAYTEYDDNGDPVEPVVSKPVYRVTFDPCGGYCGRPNYSVTYESQYGELPVPGRKGYQFDGWFTQAEGGTQISSSDVYSLNEDQTLYAHWTRIVLEQGVCGDTLSYILYGDGQLDITGSGAMSSAPWTANNAARVESVALPEGITSLCSKAFSGCTCLVEINFPESLATIGDWAFRNCSLLEAVRLPADLSQLGFGAFHNCESVEEINIPAAVTTKELTGENVEYYQGPFLGCSSLSKITIEEGITTIPEGLFADCVFTEITLPSTVTSIAVKAFVRCGNLVSITLPEGLQSIGQNAFRDCVSIEEVHLPAGLTMLDLGVFTDCTSLRRVNIPSNVKTGKLAGDNVEYYRGPFVGCTSLDQITFDNGITTIPEGLFADCVMTEITLPATVTSIAAKAFTRCGNLANITLPDGLQSIGQNAFAGCGDLVAITLPEGLQSIGQNAFRDCASIEKAHLPDGLTMLDLGAFSNCTSLRSVNIPRNVKTGKLAGTNSYYRGPYAGCESLTTVIFAEGITAIPEGLFAESGITEIVIPPTVTKIANRAFKNCADLTSVTIPPATSSIASDAFSYYDRITIYGKAGTYAETFAAENNISFVPQKETVLVLPAELTTIETMAFMNSDIQNVLIGSNVRSIESGAFAECLNLRTVEFSNASCIIATDAFSGSNVTIIAPAGGTVQTFAENHGLPFLAK